MLYKISSLGYFGGVAKVSRGPWYKEHMVEDDGLDWFYQFSDADGKQCYLLSNNMTMEDRDRVAHLYKTMCRNNTLAWFGGLWLGTEVVLADRYFRKMAIGWRFLSCVGIASVFKGLFMSWSSGLYAPTLGAYFRKYQSSVQRDLWEIRDSKKEYFYIDTSQYMNYTNESIGDHYHSHHGPQPVSKIFFEF